MNLLINTEALHTYGEPLVKPIGGSNGTVWTAIDPMTGQTVYQIANVTTTGTQVYGEDGSILYYNMVNKGTTAEPKLLSDYLEQLRNTIFVTGRFRYQLLAMETSHRRKRFTS